MAEEKEILTPAAALRRVLGTAEDAKENKGGVGQKGTPPTTPPKFQFVKLFGVVDVIKFADGTRFQFRLIRRNNDAGYAPNSFLKTDDEKLAANLRASSKNKAWGIVEIK